MLNLKASLKLGEIPTKIGYMAKVWKKLKAKSFINLWAKKMKGGSEHRFIEFSLMKYGRVIAPTADATFRLQSIARIQILTIIHLSTSMSLGSYLQHT